MTKAEKIIVLTVLKEIAEALAEGAAGPCGYWYQKLADRLLTRAERIMSE